MRQLHSVGLVLLLLIAGAASVEARKPDLDMQVPWDSISATEWQIAPDSAKDLHSAAVIFEKVEVDDREKIDGKHFITIYRRVRILNDEGKSWADVEVPYFHREQKLLGVQARSIQPSGDTAVLATDQIREKQTLKSGKVKITTHSFSIPGVTSDCIVEWRLRIRIPIQYDYWAIQKSVPVLRGELLWKLNRTAADDWITAIVYPNGMRPYYIAQNLDKPLNVQRIPSLKDTKELHFDISDVPPFKEEVHSLPKRVLEGNLCLYYSGSTSPSAFWGSINGGIPRWLEHYIAKGKQIKKVVAEFDSLPNPEAKAEAAYHWLQTNMLNLSYRSQADTSKEFEDPPTADDAIKKRRADEEDINRIYCDMLRTMNIDAKLAYAKDRTENLLIQEAMYWQFDQSLVAIPDSALGYKFLSPGDKFLPYGYAPWYVEGISALVGGTTQMFHVVAFSPSNASKTSSVMNLTLTDDLDLFGTLAETRTGHHARDVRIECFDAGEAESAKLIRDKLRERFVKFEVDSITYENLDTSEKPLKLYATLSAAQSAGDLVGQRLLIRPVELLEKSDNSFTAAERTHPVILDHAFESVEAVQIAYPTGWAVDALPTDTLFENALGSCGLHVSSFEGTVAIQRMFRLNTPFVPVEQYSELKQLYAARAAQSAATVSLIKATN